MNGLTWFGARNLAEGDGRAVRRAGWRKWLLYRSNLWIVSSTDPGTNNETRRVVTVSDFLDPEFLAKDWCDELWEGGSYPPCTTVGPAKELPPSVTGGAGGWTTDPATCAGAGQGGLVPAFVVSSGDDDGADPLFVVLRAVRWVPPYKTATQLDSGVVEKEHIRGGYVALPGNNPFAIPYFAKLSIPVSAASLRSRLRVWICGAGTDLSGISVSAADAITGAVGPIAGGTFFWQAGGIEGVYPTNTATPFAAGPEWVSARVVLVDDEDPSLVLAHRDLRARVWTPFAS